MKSSASEPGLRGRFKIVRRQMRQILITGLILHVEVVLRVRLSRILINVSSIKTAVTTYLFCSVLFGR